MFEVFDHLERMVPLENGCLFLEEKRYYHVVLKVLHSEATCYHNNRILKRVSSGRYRLEIEHWVGRSELVVKNAEDELSVSVHVVPREDKLTPEHWLFMLRELEEWLPASSVGLEGGTSGHVCDNGAGASFLVVALLPILPLLSKYLEVVLQSPRTLDKGVWKDEQLHHIRVAGRETLAWLSRHPEDGVWLDKWKRVDLTGSEPCIPQRLVYESLDHPANRYVAWLVRRVFDLLSKVSSQLRKSAEYNSGNSDAPWNLARAEEIDSFLKKLERTWRFSPLRSLRQQPATEAALLVVLDDPAYARFHSLCRLILSPKFQLDEESNPNRPPVRPSYELYEIWCFFTLQKALQTRFVGSRWQAKQLGQILKLESTGAGAKFTATMQDGAELGIEFNSVFNGFHSRDNHSKWTLSKERRPDIIVTWKPVHGEGKWLCLDAKYRVGRANLGDAFSSVHIYRDALRHDDFGGKCDKCFLLSPNTSSDSMEWFSREFHGEHGCGIFRLRPGTDDGRELGEWVGREFL